MVRGRWAVPAVARVFAAARGAPSSVGADSISARGVCAAAGCGGMRASRPTVVRVGGGRSGLARSTKFIRRGGIYPARRRVSEANRRAAAALGPEIPPAGVCPSAGCAGRCKHRPLQGFVVTPGYRFPGGRALAFVRRGGFHIRPGCLRRRGVRRDEGIPPYGRLGDGGRSGSARSTKFIRRGGIYPARGRLRRREVRRDGGIPPYGRPGGWRPFRFGPKHKIHS